MRDPASRARAGPNGFESRVSREGDAWGLHRHPEGYPAGPSRLRADSMRARPGVHAGGGPGRSDRAAPHRLFLATLAWAARSGRSSRLPGSPLALIETWRITLEAQAGGILLPGGIGGDALRVGFVARKGGDLTDRDLRGPPGSRHRSGHRRGTRGCVRRVIPVEVGYSPCVSCSPRSRSLRRRVRACCTGGRLARASVSRRARSRGLPGPSSTSWAIRGRPAGIGHRRWPSACVVSVPSWRVIRGIIAALGGVPLG